MHWPKRGGFRPRIPRFMCYAMLGLRPAGVARCQGAACRAAKSPFVINLAALGHSASKVPALLVRADEVIE